MTLQQFVDLAGQIFACIVLLFWAIVLLFG